MSLEEMQEQVERYYIEMENELLMNIAKKLSMGKPMEIDKFDTEKGVPIIGSGGVNEWQLERLKELGGLNDENARIIAKYSGKTIDEVNKIFERAREIGTEVDQDILELGIKAGILNEINPISEEFQVKKVLDASVKEVLTTFNKQNISLLASAGTNYKEIVNKVSSQVLAGTKTINKAMEESVSELAQNGLTGFTAKNGAQWSPEAYTKMVLRTNTQNTINRIQEERMRIAGNDYVEINAYAGARPLCSEDQGKIFSLSGNTEPIQDGLGHPIKVYSWFNSSYGKPDGILGINCGHSRHMFIPGLSIHREVVFTKAENDAAYQEKQQQRLYERTIRNKKREIAMLETTNAEPEYIKRKTEQLTSYRKEYNSFLKETGRTRISSNEWIGSSKLSSSAASKSNSSYQYWKIQEEKRKKQEEFIKKSTIGKFNITKYDNSIITATKDVVLFEERIKHITERHPEVEKYIKDIPKMINNPDMILKEVKRENTIWIIKQLDDNIKITMKLNTSTDESIKNSIIQMQKMRESEINRNIKNGKAIVIFDKSNKK